MRAIWSRYLLYLAFTLSGFAGLIYESVWTQYIKLFLGHAAYAQVLVLSMFMGGLAAGSLLASKRSLEIKNALLAYALVEGLIGAAALAFHGVFVRATDVSLDVVLPALASAGLAQLYKWGLSALLILPQSVLLGMTFPLMSAALVRRQPGTAGATIAALYFANSAGAAVGVLACGFYLISHLGLPGTMLTAGSINVVLALVVGLASRGRAEPRAAIASEQPDIRAALRSAGRLLLAGAVVTGAASFLYEIAWIRLLAMVLGASTHSFELMLSAFILGLALGGLWIRRRIERLHDPVRVLGYVQVAMGLAALATLPLYAASFDLMQAILSALAANARGYGLFLLLSHLICLAVMLPATFCAGMTLPMMSYVLLKKGMGERSIGAVYGANTLGGIAGVVLAVYLLMPWLGGKGVVSVGAALDMALGIVLLAWAGAPLARRELVLPAAAALAMLAATVGLVHFDPRKLLSSVYRTGSASLGEDAEILFEGYGKTSTVGVVRYAEGTVVISTNGKPDAAIGMRGEPAPDEATMVLLGALALAVKPDARTVANIGMGSGLTTHTLLAAPQLTSVDTIEIEAFMLEGAQRFRPHVERAYSDPRSHIHIDDAKTFFSTHNSRYDIILSEPSNPWVSGVASLFSEQFYRHARNHLSADGVLAQWIQLYETDTSLFASIMKALSPYFSDYAIYCADDANALILAKKQGTLPLPSEAIFSNPTLAAELRRVHVLRPRDLEERRIGSKRTLSAMFDSFEVPANSDYFPYVDQHAAQARYMHLTALDVTNLTVSALPMIEMLEPAAGLADPEGVVTPDELFSRGRADSDARALRQALLEGRYGDSPRAVDPRVLLTQLLVQTCDRAESKTLWTDSLVELSGFLTPYLTPRELEPIWRRLEAAPCFSRLSMDQRNWLALVKAVGRRDARQMGPLAYDALQSGKSEVGMGLRRYATLAGMLGYVADGQPKEALALWARYGADIMPLNRLPLEARLLLSLSAPKLPVSGASGGADKWTASLPPLLFHGGAWRSAPAYFRNTEALSGSPLLR